MNKVKFSIIQILQKIKFACRIFSDLSTNAHPYRVVAISLDDQENYVATVQIVGKGQIFKITPEEILSDDVMTTSFSQKDIRMLTYLGYLSANSPKYKILAQRLSEKDNKILFAIKKRGERIPEIKTADEIASDKTMIQGLNQLDAHMIGYTVATEEILDEKKKMQECRDAVLNEEMKK